MLAAQRLDTHRTKSKRGESCSSGWDFGHKVKSRPRLRFVSPLERANSERHTAQVILNSELNPTVVGISTDVEHHPGIAHRITKVQPSRPWAGLQKRRKIS